MATKFLSHSKSVPTTSSTQQPSVSKIQTNSVREQESNISQNEDELMRKNGAELQKLISEIEESISNISQFVGVNKKSKNVDRIDGLISKIEDGLSKRPTKKPRLKKQKHDRNLPTTSNMFNIDKSHVDNIAMDNMTDENNDEKAVEDYYDDENSTLPKIPGGPRSVQEQETLSFTEDTLPKQPVETKPKVVEEHSSSTRAFTNDEGSIATKPKAIVGSGHSSSVSSDQSSSLETEYEAGAFEFSSLDCEILESVKELENEAKRLDPGKKEMLLERCGKVRSRVEAGRGRDKEDDQEESQLDLFEGVKEQLHTEATLEDAIMTQVRKSINETTAEFMLNTDKQNKKMLKDFEETVTQKIEELNNYVELQNEEIKNKFQVDHTKTGVILKEMNEKTEQFKECMKNVVIEQDEVKQSLENNKSEMQKITEDSSVLSAEEIRILIENFKTETLQQTEDKISVIQRESMDTLSHLVNASVRAGESQKYFDSQLPEELYKLDDKDLKKMIPSLEEYYQRLLQMRKITPSCISAHEIEICMQYNYCCAKLADKKEDVTKYIDDVKEKLIEMAKLKSNEEQNNTISILFRRGIIVALITAKKPKEKQTLDLWTKWAECCYKLDHLPKWQSQNILYASQGFYDIYNNTKSKAKKEIREICLDGLDFVNERLKLIHDAHPDIEDTAHKYLDSLRRSVERNAQAKKKEKAKELLKEMEKVKDASSMPEGAKKNWKRQMERKIKDFKLQ